MKIEPQFQSHLADLLKDPTRFFGRWTWQERKRFLEDIQLHGHQDHDLLARCCWADPPLACIIAKAAPSLVNVPNNTTKHSPLALALLNQDNWQPDLIRLLLSKGAVLNSQDLSTPELRSDLSYQLLTFLSTANPRHLLTTLSKHDADLFLEALLSWVCQDNAYVREHLYRIDMSSDQMLQVLNHDQAWFYEDSSRVQHLVDHCTTQELVLLTTRKPTLFFHLHHRDQEKILDHLMSLVPADRNRLIATHADWFLPHPIKARIMLKELPLSYLGTVLGECPQIWHHLSPERQAEVISALTSTLAPVDFIAILGRNPLAWQQVFPGLDSDQALEGLAHPSSPFHRLYKLDPDAFQQFEQFLRHADEHQERIDRFFALGPELWRLFIDHEYHQFGPNTFDQGINGTEEEKGYLEGMEATAAWLCSLESKPRTCQERLANYKLAHAMLMYHLDDDPFRTESVTMEFSEERFNCFEQVDRDAELIEINEKERTLTFVAVNIEQRLEAIFEEYLGAIDRAQTDDDKLLAIARRFQKLCHLHPFNGGNLRLNILILQHNLVEQGFEPALMEDPAGVVYLGSESTLVEKIIEGIESHRAHTAKVND